MIKIQCEPFSAWHIEASPLLQRHWEEVELHRDVMKLDFDIERIRIIERAGMWLSYTVRSDRSLIGYACLLIAPHLHYRKHRAVYVDMIYIMPEHRHGILAKRLIETILMDIKGRATKIIFHVKFAHDFGRLLERLGFEATEKTYERLL